MLVLAAAFAAPLVRISGLQNFGINIFGRAKVGKTTALLVGASTIGIGTERGLPNWNTTNNAFLETARGFNDLLVPANEVGLLAGKRRDAYSPIRDRIYAFSEGRDGTPQRYDHGDDLGEFVMAGDIRVDIRIFLRRLRRILRGNTQQRGVCALPGCCSHQERPPHDLRQLPR